MAGSIRTTKLRPWCLISSPVSQVVGIRGEGGEGGLGGSLVGGGLQNFLSARVLLECNLMGLVIISM